MKDSNLDKFDSDRFIGNCDTCGQKFMREGVEKLASAAILYRNKLTNEFGVSDYHDDILINLLKDIGIYSSMTKDDEIMTLGGDA